MAKRALDEFDQALAQTLVVAIDASAVRQALTELELLEMRDTSLTPGLTLLRDALRAAIVEAQPPSDEGV
jgi:hypothetical protein